MGASLSRTDPKIFWLLNCLFVADATVHVVTLANGQTGCAVLTKLLLCLLLALQLSCRLGSRVPATVWTAVLLCATGDVLLQPIDADYTDLRGDRAQHFLGGVLCFSIAYAQLIRYLLHRTPDWRARMRQQPVPALVNTALCLGVTTLLSCTSKASPALVAVLWLYSPVVVGLATLSVYVRGTMSRRAWRALVTGCNVIAVSDTLIGVTVFPQLRLPFPGNPAWIVGSYAVGIFLICHAVIAAESPSSGVKHADALTTR